MSFEPTPGAVVGPLRLLARLGRDCWRGEGPADGEVAEVVVQVVSAGGDREALEAAVRSARRLDHPGIARVLGAVPVDGHLLVPREWVAGLPLDALGTLDPGLAVYAVREAVRCLVDLEPQRAGATADRVHGAFGPTRIIVAEDGEIRVTGLLDGLLEAAPEADVPRARRLLESFGVQTADAATLSALERDLDRVFYGRFDGRDAHAREALAALAGRPDTAATERLDAPLEAPSSGPPTRPAPISTVSHRGDDVPPRAPEAPAALALVPSVPPAPRPRAEPAVVHLVWFAAGFATAVLMMLGYLAVSGRL